MMHDRIIKIAARFVEKQTAIGLIQRFSLE